MRTVLAVLAGTLLLACCGTGGRPLPMVETEEEGAASRVQYMLSQALAGDVFSACKADTAGGRDEACVELVRQARPLELSGDDALVEVDASKVEVSDDRRRFVIPRSAITVPPRAADWLAEDAEFIVSTSSSRIEIRNTP